jgi:hypothetical protein
MGGMFYAALKFNQPIGAWGTTEDVPFAVELRDGGPGVVLRQARA